MDLMYGTELLQRFRSGQKEFADIHLQFCDLEGLDLSGLVIRDSLFEYSSLRESVLKNAKLINCKMFFFSFYGADLSDMVIDRCRMEIIRLDNAKASRTKIANSDLSYCLMTGTNDSEIDFFNTRQFKVIRNLADMNDSDISELLQRLGTNMESLPLEIRLHLKKVMERVLGEVGKSGARAESKANPYESRSGAYSKSSDIYGALNAISQEMLKYGASEQYRSKSRYS